MIFLYTPFSIIHPVFHQYGVAPVFFKWGQNFTPTVVQKHSFGDAVFAENRKTSRPLQRKRACRPSRAMELTAVDCAPTAADLAKISFSRDYDK